MKDAKFLIPTEKATKRTLNRLRENGPMFHLGREMPVVCLGNGRVQARLVHSTKNNWVGWLASDEIRIVRHPLTKKDI